MGKSKVISREYKIMLKASEFVGDQQQLLNKASDFWQDFIKVIGNSVFDTDGDLDKIKQRRIITFFDTAKLCLRNNCYVFRTRRDLNDDEEAETRELTLKFRHHDRYISAGRDMTAVNSTNEDLKFEEDIKSPFQSLFSHSNKHEISPSVKVEKLGDIAKVFEDIKTKLPCYDPDEKIMAVADHTARELVITGGDFEIEQDPKIEAECALIVWYKHKGSNTKPDVVEFSFRYGNEDENYEADTAGRVYDVFMLLQKEMDDWVDADSLTKTAFVYSLLGDSTRIANTC
jgi:hypothetical protein